MTAEPFYNAPMKPNPQTVDIPRDTDGNTYLHELCDRNAPVALIREAVEKLGANINAFNKNSLPPLGTAILRASPEVVECLINLGAELYLPTPKGTFFNATFLAAAGGKGAALDTILAHQGGRYVNEPGINDGGVDLRLRALHAAVKGGSYTLIAPLVAAGAFVNDTAGYQHETPLYIATEKNMAASIRGLVESGADIEQRAGGSGLTPLLHAATQRNDTAMRTLLDMGANPDAVNNIGETALMIAARNGDVGQVNMLLLAGANPDLKGGVNDETALMMAARKGSHPIVESLLKAHADPLLTDKFNRTAQRFVVDTDYTGLREQLERVETNALQQHFETSYRKYRP